MDSIQMQFVNVKDINVDYSYQRPLDVRRVERLKRAFNRGACKAVSLSRRDDGSLWVYDGQHTLALAIACDLSVVPAVIVKGDRQKEARWFLLMNSSGVSKATSRERHGASVVAGDGAALAVTRLMEKYGVVAAKGGTKAGTLSCFGSLYGWARSDFGRLERVFSLVASIWPEQDGAWTQIVLRGLWDIAENEELLAQVKQGLAKYKITPRRVLDTASGMQLSTGVPGGGAGYAAKAIRQLARVRAK